MDRSGWLPFTQFTDKIENFELTVHAPSKYKTLGIGTKMDESKDGPVLTTKWKSHSPVTFPTVIFGDYIEDTPEANTTPQMDDGDAFSLEAPDEDAADGLGAVWTRRRKRRPRRWVKAARKRLLLHMGAIILATSLVVAGLLGVAHYYAASAVDTEAAPR